MTFWHSARQTYYNKHKATCIGSYACVDASKSVYTTFFVVDLPDLYLPGILF